MQCRSQFVMVAQKLRSMNLDYQYEVKSIVYIQGPQVFIEGNQPRSGNVIENYEPPTNPLKYGDGRSVRKEEKSVPLLKELLSRFAPENASVLDVFAGTGSTGLACIEMGHSFFGTDTDKECVELASERLFDHYKSLYLASNISIFMFQINFPNSAVLQSLNTKTLQRFQSQNQMFLDMSRIYWRK